MGGIRPPRIHELQEEPRFQIGPDTALALLEQRDAAALLRLVEDSRAHLERWLPWVSRIRDMDGARELIRVAKQQRTRGRGLRFGIRHGGALAGVVTLAQISRRRRHASTGYWLDHRYQGRGLVSASVAALSRYAFETLRLGRVEISTAVDNARSRRVAERLGFQLEGILRCRDVLHGAFVDHAVYALTVHDPLPPRLTVAADPPRCAG